MIDSDFEELFIADRPVLFAFHGYPHVIDGLVHRRANALRIQVEGYREEGTTSTPFDMVVRNRISRFHLAMQALDLAGCDDSAAQALRTQCPRALAEHELYIWEHFGDMPSVQNWRWATFASSHSE